MKKASEGLPNHLLKDLRLLRNWTQADVAEQINTTSLNVSRWERGLLVPSLHFRQELCKLFGKSSAELGLVRKDEQRNHPAPNDPLGLVEQTQSLAEPPFYWQVPYPRNPFFTGRTEMVQTLYTAFHSTSVQSYALSGPGGIGKTQVALEYTYLYACEYEAVFWIMADTREHIVAGFASLADLLHLPATECQGQHRLLLAVKHWLHTHKNWLLVFDDVEDPELLKGFLPATRTGTILLTTQRATSGNIALTIEIDPLNLADATQLLLRRARILAPAATLSPTADDALIARAIVEMMGGLPLAIDQAGAYIDENKCSLAEFQDLFWQHPLQLLCERGFCNDHPHSVVQTISLAFEKIQQKNLLAADLLILCCFLSLDAIPESALLEYFSYPYATNTLQFNLLLKEVFSLSLLRRHRETRTLTIHPLVQAILTAQLDTQAQQHWAERASKVASQIVPTDNFDTLTMAL